MLRRFFSSPAFTHSPFSVQSNCRAGYGGGLKAAIFMADNQGRQMTPSPVGDEREAHAKPWS
jgi:hypothetical protein